MITEMFPAVIVAGGLATRLRPLTEKIPKALIDVNGEPFIARQLRLLSARGISQVVVCAGYRGEMIRAAIGTGENFGLHVEFVFDGPKLLGTAGAIKQALPLAGPRFFVLYGDSYLPCDYRAVQTAFCRCGKSGLMTVFHNHGRWESSNVEYVDGCILVYDKRHPTPRMQHIDYGLGVFERNAFERVPDNQTYDLATFYQQLIRDRALAAYEVSERFYEIGSFAGLEETRQYIASHGVVGESHDA